MKRKEIKPNGLLESLAQSMYKTGISLSLLACCLLCAGVTSCSNEDEGITPEATPAPLSLSLTVGDYKETDTSGSTDEMYSDNPFVASIEEDGVIYAEHVGATTIHIGQQIINVTVTGSINLFKTPVIDWTATPSIVKQKHELGGWTTENFVYTNSNNINCKLYMYKACDTPVAYSFYYFDISETLMQSEILLYSEIETETVFEHLSEHYFYIGQLSGTYVFTDAYQPADASTLILLNANQYMTTQNEIGFLGGNYHFIDYIPYEYDNPEDEESGISLKSIRKYLQTPRTDTDLMYITK